MSELDSKPLVGRVEGPGIPHSIKCRGSFPCFFQCPNKNVRVQGWTIEDMSDDDSAYAPVKRRLAVGFIT